MTHFLKRAILCSTLVLNEKKGGESEMFDYVDLVDNHVYCDCPSMLLNCEEFKLLEGVERVNQGKLYADYITPFLVSDYLAELLKNAGEFIVCADDFNVWLFDSSVTVLTEQLKDILG